MQNSRIDGYFRVSKTPQNIRRAKRLVLEKSPETEVTTEAKKPAYQRFAHLVSVVEKPDAGLNPKQPPSTVCKVDDSVVDKNEPLPAKEKTVVQRKKRIQPKKVSTLQSSKLSFSKLEKDEKLPAFKRFAYLTEPIISSHETQSNELKITTDIVESAISSTNLDLTQTDLTIPVGLILPHKLRVLLELFRSCDTVVSMLHNRKELCSFDKLQPAVQEIVRRNFEENHVGQFLTVYPMVYFLHYEKQFDKFTHRPNGNYVLVLSPNLRTDGTQVGHDSPSKGFLPFSGTRLIQRRNRFHTSLISLVLKAHRDFLISELGIDPSQLPEDSALRRWHPKFPLESAVNCIPSSPLPIKPSEYEQKITTAKDAVKAFQARALFREADTCHQISLSKQQISPIPSPKKSISSPCKSVNLANNTVSTIDILTGIQGSSEDLSKTNLSSTAANLKGISQAL
ncbi:unnamed protein product [Heterobilharzia americana]|nr:unnamed protein product [Heterobilharzia americana]